VDCILNKVDLGSESPYGMHCRLSVLLCHDGFSFLVTHADSLKILQLAVYKLSADEIRHSETAAWPAFGTDYFALLKKVDFTQHVYRQIDIAVSSYKISLAPHHFLESLDGMKIISAVHPVKPNEELLAEPVFDLGPVTLMLIPDYIRENCLKIFPNAVLRSAPAVFVKGVLRKHSQLIVRQIFINLHPEYFELTVIQGLRLLYLNSFTYSAPSDVLYYVVFVLEQLGFVPSEQDVVLMGNISETSAITEQLKLYCGSVKFAEKPDGPDYGVDFSDVRWFQHFTLLNLPLCE
jgi:hypothetical protein